MPSINLGRVVGPQGLQGPRGLSASANLLVNSDFSKPVAQPGLNSTHGSTVYAVDRWIANGCTAEQSTGCLKLTTSRSYAHIWQKVTGVAGKTLTCAAKFSGAGVCAIRVYDESITTKYAELKDIAVVGCVAFTVPDDVDTIAVLLYPNQLNVASGLIYWAALYEGTYTADTLPPYVPKGYAAELAECQRYYQEIPEQTSCAFATSAQSGKYFSSSITFNPMRITPTVSFKTDSDGKIGVVQGVAFVSPSEFDFAYIKNGCLLPSTTNAAYAGLVMSFYGIQLSADL